MVFMLFKGPIQGILATGDVYKRFEVEGMERQLWGAKAVYIVMQLGLMALGVWKVNAMGLLPLVFPFLFFFASSLDRGEKQEPLDRLC